MYNFQSTTHTSGRFRLLVEIASCQCLAKVRKSKRSKICDEFKKFKRFLVPTSGCPRSPAPPSLHNGPQHCCINGGNYIGQLCVHTLSSSLWLPYMQQSADVCLSTMHVPDHCMTRPRRLPLKLSARDVGVVPARCSEGYPCQQYCSQE